MGLLGYVLAISGFIPMLGNVGTGTIEIGVYFAAATSGWLLFRRYYIAQDPKVEELQRALAAEQLQSSAVLAAISDGVAIVNRDGIAVHASDRFLDMVALGRDELIGKHYSEVTSTRLRIVAASIENPRLGPNIAKVFETGEAVMIDSETVEYLDNRPPIDLSLAITPLKNEDDEISAVLIACRDITHIMRLQRMKDALIATASHELRTPITVIAGYADLLLGTSAGVLTDKQRHYLERTKETTDHLTDMVNDMLDISRLESGQRENNPERLDNVSVLQSMVEGQLGRFANKQIALKLDAQSGDIYADKSRLEQVIYCLLSNALKFTPADGEVTLASKITDDAMEISVTDNGPGVPADHQQMIFEKFTKLDTTGAIQGTGLGLAIAKNIVEHWNGTLGVQDVTPHGAKFFFTVPLYKKDADHEKQTKKEEA
jgi:signal transduction histidine kinase